MQGFHSHGCIKVHKLLFAVVPEFYHLDNGKNDAYL